MSKGEILASVLCGGFLQQHSQFLWNLLNNFSAGVTSAGVVLFFQWAYRLHRERQMFGSMPGDYAECRLPESEPTGGVIKVRRKGTFFHLPVRTVTVWAVRAIIEIV